MITGGRMWHRKSVQRRNRTKFERAGTCGSAPGPDNLEEFDSAPTSWKLRRLILVGWDSVSWGAACVVATVLRYDWNLPLIDMHGLLKLVLVGVVVQMAMGTGMQIYRGSNWLGGVDDAINVAATIALSGLIVFGAVLLDNRPWVPRSVPFTATLMVLTMSIGLRLAIRRMRERRIRRKGTSAQRVVILGAGPEGQQLVRSMLTEVDSGYIPVAVLDDDPAARRGRVLGVPIRGTHNDLAKIAGTCEADLLVIANRSVSAKTMREVTNIATGISLGVKVLPHLSELLRPALGVSDLRDLDITDLLGREPVDIDVSAIAGFLMDKRVLVTGAGGSIGSELCRQIHRFGPAELLMLDRDESSLHATQLSIYHEALLDKPDVILVDIRDGDTLQEIFRERRPHVVFHAAALKHLPMLEQYPEEAWKTNVQGTENVLAAAKMCGVEKFVNISTDKAANPISVLGRSKRIGERLVADAAAETTGTFLSVRFGNVLGSRGSVLTTFAEQLTTGCPVTITHPDVTRFFMTIPEAVQLVIHAAAIGRPGEVLVLDMGAPVRITDVACQLMEIFGKSAEIIYTGLRDGEKLHEELFGEGEEDRRPIHTSISHVVVPGLDPALASAQASVMGVAEAMIDLTRRHVVPIAEQHVAATGDSSSEPHWQPL